MLSVISEVTLHSFFISMKFISTLRLNMFKKEKEAYRLTYSEPGDFYSSKLVCVWVSIFVTSSSFCQNCLALGLGQKNMMLCIIILKEISNVVSTVASGAVST